MSTVPVIVALALFSKLANQKESKSRSQRCIQVFCALLQSLVVSLRFSLFIKKKQTNKQQTAD